MPRFPKCANHSAKCVLFVLYTFFCVFWQPWEDNLHQQTQNRCNFSWSPFGKCPTPQMCKPQCEMRFICVVFAFYLCFFLCVFWQPWEKILHQQTQKKAQFLVEFFWQVLKSANVQTTVQNAFYLCCICVLFVFFLCVFWQPWEDNLHQQTQKRRNCSWSPFGKCPGPQMCKPQCEMRFICVVFAFYSCHFVVRQLCLFAVWLHVVTLKSHSTLIDISFNSHLILIEISFTCRWHLLDISFKCH